MQGFLQSWKLFRSASLVRNLKTWVSSSFFFFPTCTYTVRQSCDYRAICREIIKLQHTGSSTILFQVVNEKRQTAIPVGKEMDSQEMQELLGRRELLPPLNISKKYALLQFVI